MAKIDSLPYQNLIKFNFFQAKKLKHPKKGQTLQASCILFQFIHPVDLNNNLIIFKIKSK